MLFILIALLAGIAFSFTGKVAQAYLAFFKKVQNPGVLILIFSIGFLVGSNPQVMQDFTQIGWRALLISSFSVAGSIVFAYCGEKYFNRG